MTEAERALFHDSLSRCTSDPRFLERFYESLLASSVEIRQKFQHTNLPKQRRMLQASLYMIMLAAEGLPEGDVHLARIAATHSRREHNTPPHLYDLWLECLIQTVRTYDRQCTPEVENVWARMMEHGMTYMKERYSGMIE